VVDEEVVAGATGSPPPPLAAGNTQVFVYISRLTSVPGWVGPGQSVEKTLGSGGPSEQPDTVSTAESDQNTTIDEYVR
jgi:hypothetical protein